MCIAGMILLAADVAPPQTWSDPIAGLGATGILGAALLWLLCKTLPRMTRDFRDALESECTRHSEWERLRHEDQQRLEELLSGLNKKDS